MDIGQVGKWLLDPIKITWSNQSLKCFKNPQFRWCLSIPLPENKESKIIYKCMFKNAEAISIPMNI